MNIYKLFSPITLLILLAMFSFGCAAGQVALAVLDTGAKVGDAVTTDYSKVKTSNGPKETKDIANQNDKIPIRDVDTDQIVIKKIGPPLNVIKLDGGTKQVFEYRKDNRIELLAFQYNEERGQLIFKDAKNTSNPNAIQKFEAAKEAAKDDEKQLRIYLFNLFPIIKREEISSAVPTATPGK